MRIFPILAGLLMLLAGCGTRGPLTLPPAQKAPANALADHNSAAPGARS